MKKLFGVVLAGLLSLGCVACAPKNETAICTLEVPENGQSYEITLEAERGIIKTLKQSMVLDLSMYKEEEVELVQENIDALEELYEDFKGAEYTGRVEDGFYYDTLIIDLTDAETITAMTEAGRLPIEAKANKTSLDKIVANLKEMGWTVEIK